MANKQSFIYDTDDGGFNENPFNVNKPVLLRAAGLTACVPIYMAVGDCPSCRPADVKWEPIMSCGAPVELCPDNNQLMISIPGKYSIGDPLNPAFVVPGTDVNITKEEGVDPSLMGKCELMSAPEEPQPDLIPVEVGMAELGCVTDESGNKIGKVMICKVIDEITGSETTTLTAYYTDGLVETDYVGQWSICEEDKACLSETPLGVITDLTVLQS